MNSMWPTVDPDPLIRMRILSRSLPALMYAEAHLAEPVETVWRVASDLEKLPAFVPSMREFRIMSAEGDRLAASAVSLGGHRADFDITLRPGWCLMQSRMVIGGMAATAEDGGTRFVVLGGLRVRGTRMLRPVLGPAGSWLGRGMLWRLQAAVRSNPDDIW